MIETVSSVRIPVPEDRAEMAREFYHDVLELEELDVPQREGQNDELWFRISDGRLVHLEEDPHFTPSHDMYPIFAVTDLTRAAARFEEFLFDVEWDSGSSESFCVHDPFGNRLAFCSHEAAS